MNHRKHKQKENLSKSKKEKNNLFTDDPEGLKCPHCGKSKFGCSHVNSLSRAWSRYCCKKKSNI